MLIATMPAKVFVSRRSRLRRHLRSLDVNALLMTHPVHVRYLTGFTGDDSYLILHSSGEVVISDFRYRQQLVEECPDLECEIRSAHVPLLEATARLVEHRRWKKVAYESQALWSGQRDELVSRVPRVEWRGTQGLVEDLRKVKDRHEIAAIRRSIGLAEDAFQQTLGVELRQASERDVAAMLEYQIRRLGGDGCSFPPLVAAGRRAALPHARPSSVSVRSAAFLLVDWGATWDGYVSDLTRMVAISKITRKFQRIWQIVHRAQSAAIRRIRPGESFENIDVAARRIIATAGYEKYFGHAVGHGIGMQVHEAPRLGPGQSGLLQAGMVVTVEPGIYLPGWGGIRLEQNVLVTRDGYEVLSSLPQEVTTWPSLLDTRQP